MKDAVEQYLQRSEARRAENTVNNRRIALDQFIEYIDVELDEVEQYHIEDWIDSMLIDDYAPRTIRNKVYCISSFFGFCKARGIVSENPVSDVDTSDYSANRMDSHTEIRYLTVDEYEAMLDECDRLRNEIVLRLLWDTGVRRQEAVDITRSDIDMDQRSIEIVNAKTSKLAADETRTVYFTMSLARCLHKWFERGGRDKYLGTTKSAGDPKLLVTKQQPQMAPKRVTEIVDEIGRRVGEPEDKDEYGPNDGLQEILYETTDGRGRRRLSAHTFRHSYAVHSVKQGMPIVYLQELLGHNEIEMTRQYLRFKDEDIEEAARKYRP